MLAFLNSSGFPPSCNAAEQMALHIKSCQPCKKAPVICCVQPRCVLPLLAGTFDAGCVQKPNNQTTMEWNRLKLNLFCFVSFRGSSWGAAWSSSWLAWLFLWLFLQMHDLDDFTDPEKHHSGVSNVNVVWVWSRYGHPVHESVNLWREKGGWQAGDRKHLELEKKYFKIRKF